MAGAVQNFKDDQELGRCWKTSQIKKTMWAKTQHAEFHGVLGTYYYTCDKGGEDKFCMISKSPNIKGLPDLRSLDRFFKNGFKLW